MIGWNPWWYNPYWYSPWPGYSYYLPYDSYSYYGNPSPYSPDASYDYDSRDYDSQARYWNTPSSNFDNLHFNITDDSADDGGSPQNSRTQPPQAAPNRPASAAQPQPLVVSQPQI